MNKKDLFNEVMESLEKEKIDINKLEGEVKLFIYGEKPALLTNPRRRYVQILMGSYPSLSMPNINSVLIFQDGNIAMRYMRDVAEVKIGKKSGRAYINYNQGEMGTTLGYPPFLSSLYNKYGDDLDRDKDNTERWCRVRYHGYSFVAPKNLVIASVNWMLENRPISVELQTGITVATPKEVYKARGLFLNPDIPYEEFKALQESVVHN